MRFYVLIQRSTSGGIWETYMKSEFPEGTTFQDAKLRAKSTRELYKDYASKLDNVKYRVQLFEIDHAVEVPF